MDQTLETQVLQAKALLLKFEKTKDEWFMPFPMGVFGTLRKGWGNDPLMHRGKVAAWTRAFLPHFTASGLTIHCTEGGSAPFEIYFYNKAEWDKMIPSVDRLEGFHPQYLDERRPGEWADYGYHRTLVWLSLLPEEFAEHPPYMGRGRGSWGERNLEIGTATWKDYDRVPCWVYSNGKANREVKKLEGNPLIWQG